MARKSGSKTDCAELWNTVLQKRADYESAARNVEAIIRLYDGKIPKYEFTQHFGLDTMEAIDAAATANSASVTVSKLPDQFWAALKVRLRCKRAREHAQKKFNRDCPGWQPGDPEPEEQSDASEHVLHVCDAICRSRGREGKHCGHRLYHPPCAQHRVA